MRLTIKRFSDAFREMRALNVLFSPFVCDFVIVLSRYWEMVFRVPKICHRYAELRGEIERET